MDILNFGFLWQYYPAFLRGLAGTIELTIIATLAGLVFGFAVAFGELHKSRTVRVIFVTYVEFFRNTPLIIQLFFFQAFIPVVFQGLNSPFVVACISFSLYNAAYCGEIFRAGVQSIERGQWEASRALGMPRLAQVRYVVLPQAVRRVLPAFTTRFIEMFKLTTLASTVAYGDILYVAKVIANTDYRPTETFTAVAIIFVVLLLPLSILANRIENRFSSQPKA